MTHEVNPATLATLEFILKNGNAYGSELNHIFLSNILRECRWVATIPNSVKEELLLNNEIFIGLSGQSPENLALYQDIASRPEEFDCPEPDPYKLLRSFVSNKKLRRI